MIWQGVPIKVIIGLRPNGHADHPDWKQLPLQKVRGERHEDHQIVKWVYDKTSGHQDNTVGSPRGQQFGMMLVTSTFADEAIAQFPELVTIMTEVEAQDFWETKGHAHLPENDIDVDVLLALKAQRDLMMALGKPTVALDAQITRALNPDNRELGVRKNRTKLWADAKMAMGFTIKSLV